MKKITMLLIISISFFAIVTATLSQEKWEQDMKKDFAKVLNAKKEAPKKHREFIGEWLKKGHLAGSNATL